MDSSKALLVGGTLLLAVSALLGFVQHHQRRDPEAFVLWRVVHNGGTAGAVQLLALASVWRVFDIQGRFVTPLVVGLIIASYAFFLGPLARALNQPRVAAMILGVGGLLGLPSYAALPLILFP